MRNKRPSFWWGVVTIVLLAGAFLLFASNVDLTGLVAGSLLMAVLFGRLYMAWGTDSASGEPAPGFLAVLIPVYNEDPALLLRCLTSLRAQTRPPDRVWIIDDCSHSSDAADVAEAFAAEASIDVRVIRLPANVGKRHAQATVIRQETDADFLLTVDSDTILDVNAVHNGLIPFNDSGITSVAGVVRAMNVKGSLLARLQDLEYVTSFVIDRGTMSRVGSVLVNSGALGFYRARVVRDHLDEYLSQTCFGAPVTSGDDRMLTQLSFRRGKTVMQYSAVSFTAVPQRWGHLISQRVRWSRSFWINGMWIAKNTSLKRPAFWLMSTYWAANLGVIITLIAVAAVAAAGGLSTLGLFFTFLVVFSYVRVLRYLAFTFPGESRAQRAMTFAMAPVLKMVRIVVYLPVRYYALATLRRGSWRTRSKGVEVQVVGADSGG